MPSQPLGAAGVASTLPGAILQASVIAHEALCERRELKTPSDSAGLAGRKPIADLGDLAEVPERRPASDKPAEPGRLDAQLDASDPVETALAKALGDAAAAGRFDVVGQLARELEARRTAKAGAIDLGAERAKRGGRR